MASFTELQVRVLRWLRTQEDTDPRDSVWHWQVMGGVGIPESLAQRVLRELKALGAIDYDLVPGDGGGPAMGFIQLTQECRRHLEEGNLGHALQMRGRLAALWSILAGVA